MSTAGVLVIAGTDSSGAAGLLRDVRTLQAFDVTTACAITAVTAQSHSQFFVSHCMPPALVRQQIDAALASGTIGAIKIGMLGNADIVAAVAASLDANRVPVVLDPVLASTSGGTLLEPSAERVLREALLPRVTLLTPNTHEAARLLRDRKARDEDDMLSQAHGLQRLGAAAVLIKGGHAPVASAVDWLVRSDGPAVRLSSPRRSARLRGSGCALASAIAAALARGLSLEEACRCGKCYVSELWREHGT